ncbi:MAG: hypothetical protein A2Y17_06675 [Clostridiales bacterium GWF2_38_85]|nr:MAG: hypothetical protein A2Y17_06675 [Clostridiales bacterium GWF2_38_85]HBL84899.1 hypothetical protein [Clostridiales bacterium]
MKVRFTKKIFAYILCMLLLILQIAPIMVFAETSDNSDAVSQAESTSVSDFTQLAAAITAGDKNIILTSDITCTSVMTISDAAAITISGDFKLITPSFNGNGIVILDIPCATLTVSGNAVITANKSIIAESSGYGVKASGSAKLTVNSNVQGFNGGNGVEISDSANVTINGNVAGGNSDAVKGGSGAVLISGKLTITGAVTGGSGVTGGGNGIELTKGILSVTGNITGGSIILNDNTSDTANGGTGLLYKGTNVSEVNATIIGNLTGGSSSINNGGAGISCVTHRFSLSVSGSVTGGSGEKIGGNGIELYYGSQVLTASTVSGGNGITRKGANFFDKTNGDVFGDYANNTNINIPTYSGSEMHLISGKKTDSSLRNLVFAAYDFTIKGQFGKETGVGTFKLQQSPDTTGINWGLEADEAVFEEYKFDIADSAVSVTYTNSTLLNKEIRILAYTNGSVSEVWSGTLSSAVTLENVVDGSYFAIIHEKVIVTYKVTTSASNNGTITPSGETVVNAGDTFSFTITPSSGYQIDKLIVNDKEQATNGSTSFTIPNIKSNITISVTFKKIATAKVNVTVTSGSGGVILPNGVISVNVGSNLTFTLTPEVGYTVDKFTVNGTAVTVSNNQFTLSNITTDTTVKATFKKTDAKFTVTATAGSGGSISPAVEQTIIYGDSVTFNITPELGFIINKLYLDGNIVMSNNNKYTITNITANHTIEVTFISEDSEDAMIKPEDIDWSAQNIKIDLTDFTRVSADVISRIVDQYSTKEIAFATLQYEIVFAPHTMSKISENYVDFGLIIDNSENQDKLAEIGAGKYVKTLSFSNSVTYLPAQASIKIYIGNQYIGRDFNIYKFDISSMQFVQMSVNTIDVGGYATITTSSPSEFAIITELVEQKYTITASAGMNGSIAPVGETEYAENSTPEYTFTPNNGYVIEKVMVDGTEISVTENTYTFEALNANHTIEVSFEQESTSIPEPTQKTNAGMVVLIIFLVVILLCAVAFVVLYKMGIIKIKGPKF